jgi:hypothetical protein
VGTGNWFWIRFVYHILKYICIIYPINEWEMNTVYHTQESCLC